MPTLDELYREILRVAEERGYQERTMQDALLRTDLTPERIDADELREAFDQEVLRHMDDPNVSFSEAVYLANIEMCRRYGLAFYKGKGGSLREVYRP